MHCIHDTTFLTKWNNLGIHHANTFVKEIFNQKICLNDDVNEFKDPQTHLGVRCCFFDKFFELHFIVHFKIYFCEQSKYAY